LFTDTTLEKELGMPDGGLRRVAILSAIRIEYQSVRAHLTNLRQEIHESGTIYERGDFTANDQSWDVLIGETGIGNTRTAVETVRVIEYFKPSLILFVGVAGGLKDVKLGDIVAATKVYGYESGKAGRKFRPRPDVRNSTHRMEQRARAEARRRDWLQKLEGSFLDPTSIPQVYVAPIASGNQVAASTDSALGNLLRSNYSDAVAVEMEGYGFLEALHTYPHIDALIIRGISDRIDDKTEMDAKNYQEVAAQHAAAFAFEILAKMDIVIPQSQRGFEAMPAPGRQENGAGNANQIKIQEVEETLSPETVTLRLLHEFRTAIPEHTQRLRIVATFDGGRYICRSAIKWLDSLDREVKRIREEAPALSFLDLGRLQNIQEKISMLESELEPFRRLRLWMSSGQRRENESKCEQIRHRCRELLTDLDQFRRQR
jgi:nucleoside phosphorylase